MSQATVCDFCGKVGIDVESKLKPRSEQFDEQDVCYQCTYALIKYGRERATH